MADDPVDLPQDDMMHIDDSRVMSASREKRAPDLLVQGSVRGLPQTRKGEVRQIEATVARPYTIPIDDPGYVSAVVAHDVDAVQVVVHQVLRQQLTDRRVIANLSDAL